MSTATVLNIYRYPVKSMMGETLTNILKTAIEQAPEVEEACNKMSPLNRMGTVEEVAAMALFLASDEASFCTGGQFPVEGGTVSQHPKM